MVIYQTFNGGFNGIYWDLMEGWHWMDDFMVFFMVEKPGIEW